MGDVFQIALKVVNSYLGPLFGVFFLAMFTKRANAFGAFWGGVSAVVLTAAIVFAENLHAWLSAHHPAAHTLLAVVDALDVGFLWVSAVGFAVTLAVGYLLSLLSANSGRGNTEWTFRAVMGRAEAAAQAK
jgi:Na+/proline symporter